MKSNNLTILFVAYKPKTDLLKSLVLQFNKLYPIIIANNSEEKLNDIFYKLKNVSVIDSKKNLGNGAGINLCLKKCKTNLALYMDIDILIDKKNFLKLLNYSNKIKKYGVLVPNSGKIKTKKEVIKKWDMEGSIMLINKKIINNIVRFDEHFFLYYEEVDFFLNCNKKNKDAFFLPHVKFIHNKSTSIETYNNFNKNELHLFRQWHYMWSKYHFYKKNFNTLVALKLSLPFLTKDILMFLFFVFRHNPKLYKKRYSRITGLVSSFLGLSSYKRL
tara:strand:- start:2169 stop:2990 length:822 start_codon:yes stop_codon:yes gene_type:complete